MRRLLFFWFALSLSCWGQFTTVSGTVTDPLGLPYAGGTIVPTLVISASPKFTVTNQPYTPPSQPVGLSSNGSFVMQLADVTALTPGGGTYSFTVCSALATVQPAFGTGPVCFTVTGITISGASQSLTTTLTGAALTLTSGIGFPSGGTDCTAISAQFTPIQPTNFTFSSAVHNSLCFNNTNSTVIAVRNPVTTSPGFDSAFQAINQPTGSVNKNRIIGVLSQANWSGSGTLSTGLIGFDAFGPTVTTSTLIPVIVGFDAEMNFGTYPTTVQEIDGMQLNGPVYTGTGPNRALVMDTGWSHPQGINIGLDQLSGSFAGANDFAIRQNNNNMKNQFGRVKIADQGNCTMVAGTCSAQSFSSGTYNAVPNCIVTWNGSGTLTGILKAPSTTSTVTPASSVGTDTAVVNWACFGN